MSRLANAARTGRGASRQVAPAGADDHAAEEDAEHRDEQQAPRRGRPSGGAGCDQTSFMRVHPEAEIAAGRAGRRVSCVRSEVECQSALRSVRDRVGANALPVPVFNAFILLAARAGRQRNYACRAFRKELHERFASRCIALARFSSPRRRPPAPASARAARILRRRASPRSRRSSASSARCPIPPSRARRCGASPPRRTTSARPRARRTPSGSWREFQEWGFDAHIETFDVLFPTPQGAGRRARRAREVPRVARRDAAQGRSDLRPDRPAASDLQRLLDRRRGTAPLVYVNYGVPDDYERARAARRRREGQDRHRPLRRRLARHQAEGRGRERRGRLHHLLRPAATTASSRARSIRRAPSGRSRASQRGSVADMPIYSGDPLTPGVGADEGRQAPRPQGRADDHEDPGPADLLRRREAAARGARGAGRARGLARRAADHVPRRARDRRRST